jgi:hypothetical protein
MYAYNMPQAKYFPRQLKVYKENKSGLLIQKAALT